jgi:hypothetical protein
LNVNEISAELDFARIVLSRGVCYSSKEQVLDIRLFNTSVGKNLFIVPTINVSKT